jgi:hypothetical protein
VLINKTPYGRTRSKKKRITARIICAVLVCRVPTRPARAGCSITGLLLALAAAIRAEHLPIKTYTFADEETG